MGYGKGIRELYEIKEKETKEKEKEMMVWQRKNIIVFVR